MFELIAFDADDTLWHNETIFQATAKDFAAFLAGDSSPESIQERLFATEMKNLRHFGYGIKGFTLSMIETAIELTDGRVTGSQIKTILGWGHAMLQAPVSLLDGVRETIESLAVDHRLMLLTKGDLFDQESKLARSGLGDYFAAVEIVSEKNARTYATIMARHKVTPPQVPDGRQLAALGHPAGARGRRNRHPYSVRHHLGPRARRRRADGRKGLHPAGQHPRAPRLARARVERIRGTVTTDPPPPRQETAFLSTSTGRSSTASTSTCWPGARRSTSDGIELSVWRIHRKIGMSGGLFTNMLLRETGLELDPERVERLAEAARRRPTGVIAGTSGRCPAPGSCSTR